MICILPSAIRSERRIYLRIGLLCWSWVNTAMKGTGAALLVGLAAILTGCGPLGSNPWAQEEILNVSPYLVGLPDSARVGEPVPGMAQVGMPDSCSRFRDLRITYHPDLSPREVRITAYIRRPVGVACMPVFWTHEELFTLVFAQAGTWEVRAGAGSPFVPTQTHTIAVVP